MARSLNLEDVKRGDLLRVWPQDLIVDPAKRGRHFPPTQERVEEIGTSIGTQGQEQPVPCTVTHDKRLELYAGFTRYEGIMWWNSQHPDNPIRIECVVKDRDPKEAFLSNLRENRVRNNVTVIDDAGNIRRLSEQFGMTDEEICAEYGAPGKPMSPSWLEGMRALVRLPEAEKAKIHAGELSKSVGLQLAQMAPEVRDQLLKEAAVEGGGKVTTTSVLKAARKRGALRNTTALKMPEVKTGWTYLKDQDKNPRVVKLASAFLDWQAGKLPEPDFFKVVHKLLG